MPEPTGTTPAPQDRRRNTRMVAVGVVAVLLIWFALANLHQVSVNFWVVGTRTSLIVVVVVSGLLGAAIALLASRRRRRSPGA